MTNSRNFYLIADKFIPNSHAGAWSLRRPEAVKSILLETLSLNSHAGGFSVNRQQFFRYYPASLSKILPR